ncbi:eukaryotic translation initiation factor eIF1-like [Drosophila pseudoobscura]|uniref:Eukaryotic translation initiation factor eIF1-like n=1 Tax=Drosophila pseudoobscura pseudoobscura TaxID=46245 RepID=B5DLP0_DROPS|nr:eukaryotic translation initiation factor eIF1 [Drosophila pseudoobscura]
MSFDRNTNNTQEPTAAASSDPREESLVESLMENLVHIRVQQRSSSRKTITTVQGLAAEFDLKKITRACRKEFACNGTVTEHPDQGLVIHLEGDQRENVRQWLIKMDLCKPDQLKLH